MDQNSNQEPDLWAGYDSTKHKGFFDNLKSHFIDFIQTFVVFAAIFSLIYWQVAQPHKVSGNSMIPTFRNEDYILTDKLSYKFLNPQHGDVVVLKNPRDENQDFIKRIIGLPGDNVMILTNMVYINGQALNENYLPSATITRGGAYLLEGRAANVGKDEFFVMGDNREHSSDSREWGMVPKKDIIGKVFLRYWPPQTAGLFKHLP